MLEIPQAVLDSLMRQGLEVQQYRARMLKASQSRPVVRYLLICFDHTRQTSLRKVVISKGYYRDDGALMFEVMQQLWQDGFGSDRALTIPEPFDYLPESRLLLQGRAPGRSLYTYLAHPAAGLRHVARVAHWLAKLHGARLKGAPTWLFEHEQQKVLNYRDTLVRLFPTMGTRIAAIANYVLGAVRALDAGPHVPTHGDFQPKNIYIGSDQVTVIDFDRFALAHPARDLGHFVCQCMTMSYVRSGSFEAISAWNAVFLDEYARQAGPWALAALPIFIARTFLEVLYYKLFVRPVKDPSFISAWLDECERWVERVRVYGEERV